MRKLKLWNGRDWGCRGGHLYVAAHSVKDAVGLANEACRKLKGHEGTTTVHEVRTYWSPDCWRRPMDGIEPERGVWWQKERYGRGMEPPVRVL